MSFNFRDNGICKKSSNREFIIGTENSIVEHLQYMCPDKTFYPLSKELVCPNMKLTTLVDVLRALKGQVGEEITLPSDTIKKHAGVSTK